MATTLYFIFMPNIRGLKVFWHTNYGVDNKEICPNVQK